MACRNIVKFSIIMMTVMSDMTIEGDPMIEHSTSEQQQHEGCTTLKIATGDQWQQQ